MTRISKDAYNALTTALRALERDNNRNYSIYSKCTYGKEKPLEWEVNWSSIGAVDPDQALEFAQGIARFAEIARTLTGQEFLVDYNKPGTIETAEQFDQEVRMVYELLENGQNGLQDFLANL